MGLLVFSSAGWRARRLALPVPTGGLSTLAYPGDGEANLPGDGGADQQQNVDQPAAQASGGRLITDRLMRTPLRSVDRRPRAFPRPPAHGYRQENDPDQEQRASHSVHDCSRG